MHANPWGKYDPAGPTSHHLAHHCADVAACFEIIAGLPVFRARLEQTAGQALSPKLLNQLIVLAFLHDIGKLHPGFQAKGWPPGIWRGPMHGHGGEGLALAFRGAPARVSQALDLAGLGWWALASPLMVASLSHHGRPLSDPAGKPAGWDPVSTPGWIYDPAQAAKVLSTALRTWFPDTCHADGDVGALSERPTFVHLFAGLVALADWVGSDAKRFLFEPTFRPDYIHTARERARAAVAAVRLNVEALRPRTYGRTDFTTFTGFTHPAPHQQALADLSQDERLIVLEAETGAGKTEAAFWRYARLFEAGRVDGLYFALPTRAAAMQVQGRINRMLRRLLDGPDLEAVLAVPGYLVSGDSHAEPLPHWRVRWDDEGRAAEDVLAARWAAENARRFLAAPVAVGTVDQAMLATLQVKHAHLRAACLARSLLVIDEVHASDRYMGEIQAALLDAHLARGGHALLMSATLGSGARTRWLQGRRGEAPSLAAAIAAPYPALWRQGIPTPLAVAANERRKTISMSLAPEWGVSFVVDAALRAARIGAKVLVIRNTVTAAIATWEGVLAAGAGSFLLQVADGPALHHGRFAPEDREILDAAVERALAPGVSADQQGRSRGGGIIIGSQTLEQSLDIDADYLITDLCPVDVLLQRLGRLHRNAQTPRPPGHTQPACLVLTPEKGLAPLLAPAFDNGLGAWRERDGTLGGIYIDLSILELTRRLVVDHAAWTIPDMNRFLVESATHQSCVEALHQELGKAWATHYDKVAGLAMARSGAARMGLLPVNEPFEDLRFPPDEMKIRTRLGAEGARLTLPSPEIGPFGGTISALTLPAHWSQGLNPMGDISVRRTDQGIRVGVDGRWFLYDRRGLRRDEGP